jgi:hypothetical protein
MPGLWAQNAYSKKQVLMPRRPATIEQDIPLYLIPHIVMRGVRTLGEELERVIVQKTRRHFYTVSIRTRPVKRELKGNLHPLCRKHKNAKMQVNRNEPGPTTQIGM